MPRLLFLQFVFMLLLVPVQAAKVQAVHQGDSISLSNDAISATWSVRNGSLQWQSLVNHLTRTSLPLSPSVFALLPKEGPVLPSSDFKIVAAPVIEDALVSKDSSKAADRLPGRQVRIELEDPSATIHVTWTAILREGANYVRQEITIHAEQEPFAWRKSFSSTPSCLALLSPAV